MAKVLEFQLKHHSFQRNPRVDLLRNGLVGSPCSPRDSQESSPTLIARRNINNLRYADDTTFKAESEEELKSLLMKVKEESDKVGSTFRKQRSWRLVLSLQGK